MIMVMKIENTIPKGKGGKLVTFSKTWPHRNINIYMAISKELWASPVAKIIGSIHEIIKYLLTRYNESSDLKKWHFFFYWFSRRFFDSTGTIIFRPSPKDSKKSNHTNHTCQ
jgi:hypothetical protein